MQGFPRNGFLAFIRYDEVSRAESLTKRPSHIKIESLLVNCSIVRLDGMGLDWTSIVNTVLAHFYGIKKSTKANKKKKKKF